MEVALQTRPETLRGQPIEEVVAGFTPTQGPPAQVYVLYLTGLQGYDLAGGQLRAATWEQVHLVVRTLLDFLRTPKVPLERRVRQCLAFIGEMRKARVDRLEARQFPELLQILRLAAEAETPADPLSMPLPGRICRMPVLTRTI